MAEEDNRDNVANMEEKDDSQVDQASKDASDAKSDNTPKKSSTKAAAKSPGKAKAKPKEEPSDEEDDSDDEELVGILDQPLVVTGKRDRKSTEFLVTSFTSPHSTEKKTLDVPEGKGESLGSMPRVQFQLNRIVGGELKPLHKLLFGRNGTVNEIKRNIRQFKGFDFEKGSTEYEKKKAMVDRFFVNSLHFLADILDVDRKKKTSAELSNAIMDFLMEPKASGLPVEETKKKTPKQSKSKRKRKRTPKKETKSPRKKSKETVEPDEDEDEDEDKDDEEAEQKESEPSPKKRKISEKKESKKKETKKPAKKEKKVVPIKISPGRKGKKVKVAAKVDSDSSDDEPLVKKTKKAPPTNDDIVDVVKDLLDGADLEKITMKSVCKQVYDRFPEFDLSQRKDFIKETVKEIIT